MTDEHAKPPTKTRRAVTWTTGRLRLGERYVESPSLRADFRHVRRFGYVLALFVSVSTLSLLDAVGGLGNALLAAFGAEDASDLYDGFTRYAPLTLSVIFSGLTAIAIARLLSIRKRLAQSRNAMGSTRPAGPAANAPERGGLSMTLWGIFLFWMFGWALCAFFAALGGLFMVGQQATDLIGFEISVDTRAVWHQIPGDWTDKLVAFPGHMAQAYAEAYGWAGFACAWAIGIYLLWACHLLLRHLAPARWPARLTWIAVAWSRTRATTVSVVLFVVWFETNLLGGIMALWMALLRTRPSQVVKRVRNL